MYKSYYKRYRTGKKSSVTLDTILAFIYRKHEMLARCGKKSEEIMEGLQKLGLVKKVQNKKGIFFFSTDEAKGFKAIDFAREYLLAFHNVEFRRGNKILVFDSSLPEGRCLMDASEAIKQGMI